MNIILLDKKNHENSYKKNKKYIWNTKRVFRKKGFTYLLVTSFLVVVLLMIFFATSNYKYQDQESLQQVRIRAMNDFMKNLDNDIHRATYISAFRALLTLEQRMINTGSFSNVSDSFKEAFFYGTINGTTEGTTMINSTFKEYLSRVQEIAASTGITLDINVTDIELTQHDPWSLDVTMMMNITAIDNKNTASWHIYKAYTTNLPIDTLKDPLYIRNTGVFPPEGIRRLNTTILVNGSDVTNLRQHIEGVYYIASPYAPSYIMRFEGNSGSDPNGIESIVNYQDLENIHDVNPGIILDPNKVKIDYIYFGAIVNSTDKVCNVSGIPINDYFVIPLNRINMYQIGNISFLNSTNCP